MKLSTLLLPLVTATFLNGCGSGADGESPIDFELEGAWRSPTNTVEINDQEYSEHKISIYTQSNDRVDVADCSIHAPEYKYDIEDVFLRSRTHILFNDDGTEDSTINPPDFEILNSSTLHNESDSSLTRRSNGEDSIQDATISLEFEDVQELPDQQIMCTSSAISSISVGASDQTYRHLRMRVDANDSIYLVKILYPIDLEVDTYSVIGSAPDTESDDVIVNLFTTDEELIERFGSDTLIPNLGENTDGLRQEIVFTQLDDLEISGNFTLNFNDVDDEVVEVTFDFELNFIE